MSTFGLILLGMVSGAGAGLLAGLIGIGGGIEAGTPADQAAHVAIGTSLAAILPAALISSLEHWHAGNTDIRFLRDWGPGIATGVVVAQLAAPHLRGSLLTGIFSLLCLIFSARFALPGRFAPVTERAPTGGFRNVAGTAIGLFSGLAGVGGGILTNIVMSLSGMPMHKSVGRRSGQRPCDYYRGARAGVDGSDPARQHRHCRLNLHCAGSGRNGVAGRAAGAACRRRQSEPYLGHRLACNRGRHAAFQRGRAVMGHSGATRPLIVCAGKLCHD